MNISTVARTIAIAALAAFAAHMAVAATAPPSREAWRTAMAHVPLPKKGCFKASYPNLAWQEVPCAPPTKRTFGPGPFSVGHGNDFSATVPGTMSSATGSFDAVNSTGETGVFGADSYSLQLNSKFFHSPDCAAAQIPNNCQGWAQFIYAPSVGGVFIEYWLIHWGNVPCPAGWVSHPPSCLLNTPTMPAPAQTVAALAQDFLTGTASAGGMDTVTLATPGNMYAQAGDDATNHLAQGWNYAEFNIFGDGGNSDATFNPGSNLIVRTAVTDGTMNAPNCQGDGFTAETNNLNIVTPCCPYGGPAPAIVFDESNNPNATSMCAGGTSIGDTHLTNVNGLLYDFQASGDFLLAETDPKFVVQTRQASGAPMWPNAAVNKAVALQLGTSRVAVCVGPERLIVDGKPAVLGDGQSLALPGGDGISHNGNVYTFTRKSSESVRAEMNAGWINVTVGLGNIAVARVKGLLGNVNGPMGPDDLASRGGAVLPQPVDFGALYQPYGDSWRIPPAQSLPEQLCGEHAAGTGNPQRLFYANDLEPKVARRARQICLAAGVRNAALLEACTLDAAVLDNKAAAAAFARANPPRAVLHPVARGAPR